jgi:hypothetical protein
VDGLSVEDGARDGNCLFQRLPLFVYLLHRVERYAVA